MPTLHVEVIAGRDLASKDSNGLSDPFCKLVIQNPTKGAKKGKDKSTAVISKTLNPTWNEEFTFALEDPTPCVLRIQCWDKDKIGTDFMGEIFFPLESITSTPNRSWYPVQQKKGGKGTISGDLEVSVYFEDNEKSTEPNTEPKAKETPTKKLKSSKKSSKKEKVLVGQLFVNVVAGRDLASKDSNGFSDPFCKISLRDGKDASSSNVKETAIIKKTLNPEWNEELKLSVYQKHVAVKIACLDKDPLKTDFMGQIVVPLSDLASEKPQWMPLQQKKGGKGTISGDLLLGFRFIRLQQDGELSVVDEAPVVEEEASVEVVEPETVVAPAVTKETVPEGYESESESVEAVQESEEEEQEDTPANVLVEEVSRAIETAPVVEAVETKLEAVARVVETKAAPVVEAVESKAAPVVEAVETRAAPVVEAVKTKAAPIVEAVKTKAAPVVKAAEKKVVSRSIESPAEEVVKKVGSSNTIIAASVGVLILAILLYFLYSLLF